MKIKGKEVNLHVKQLNAIRVCVEKREEDGAPYLGDVVFTKWGIVKVESIPDKRHISDFTSFEFVHAGRYYYANAKKSFDERFLGTLAMRFAREIAEGGD